MREGTPSRITSHGIRLTKIHIFVRVYRHELFSWEFTVTATLMKIMLLPGLHRCFQGGFLWYFVRVRRHEWILWDLCYFMRVMLFRESSPSRMDFVRVMLFRESSPSWMDFVRVWHFAGVQHHENKFFRESINHHENYPTEASQSKFQLHTWSKYNKFQYTYIHIYRQLIPISMYSNFNPIVQPLQ